jgi:Ca2+-binding RTX toxin-like protein
MATETFVSQVPLDTSTTGTAVVTVADASQISLNFTTGEIDSYFGNFTYAADGSVAGGTLTGLQSSLNGLLVLNVTGINASAVQVANAILHGDPATAASVMFAGDDSFAGSVFNDPIEGYAGNDVVIALDGNDSVDGGDGNDDVNGNKGEDIVLGGAGNDSVRGGQGNDTVLGGDGDDGHVNGNIGDDLVYGGNGNDTVYGGQGNDTIYGNDGADHLSGDLGNDVMYGGAGGDRFAIAKGGGFDWVADFNATEGDRIELAAGAHYTVANVSGQVAIVLDDGTQLGLTGVAFASFDPNWVVFV